MTRLASWADYGTHDESAYPDLWRGCVVAWAPCLGPTGANLVDLSRFANYATLTGVTLSSAWAVLSGRYSFLSDGVNDRAVAPPQSSLNFTRDLTVSYWVYPLTSGTNTELFGKFGAGEVVAGSPWDTYRDSSSRLNFRINGSTIIANPDFVLTTGTIPQNAWTFVTVRKLGGELSAWLNGVLDSAETGNGDMVTSTGSLSLAAYPNGSFPLNAHWDDIRVYNRALSAAEIRLLGSRRGIAFERRKRKQVYVPQISARRLKILTGQT